MLFPIVAFNQIELSEANRCMREWGHAMGPLQRANFAMPICHGMFHEGRLVAATIVANLIRPAVGGCVGTNRSNTIELARLCADRPHLCRVALRMWREFVFPTLGFPLAISYQDADLHSGATYRFDGWKRVAFSRSGVDRRSGRRGRRKWVWAWYGNADLEALGISFPQLRVFRADAFEQGAGI